jgi:two-component system response regulator MtrA
VLFEGEGFTVRQAKDGFEAVEVLRSSEPECMVLDLMMPGMDGREVLEVRQAEQLAPSTRVVVLTAKADGTDTVWCWEAGADEYITKPFEPDRLVRIVRELSALTAEQAARRREVGLAEARRLDAIEKALPPKPPFDS